MAVTQYIGSRYVPLFADPSEWSNTKTYEALTIVLHQGNSYTSKQFVPIGIDINNTEYWAITGNYNAQVESYRQDVVRVRQDVEDLREDTEEAISTFETNVNQRITNFQNDTNETIENFRDDVNENIENFETETNNKIEGITEDYYYDEIELIETSRIENTDYYVVRVPLNDSEGNVIQPTMVKHEGENPLENAIKTGATLGINGSATVEMTGGTFAQGVVIGNGVIINEHSYASDEPISPLIYNLYLCFDERRNLTEIPLNTNPSGATLLAAGYKNVFQCYAKLASNGVMQPLSDWDPRLVVNGTQFSSLTRNPMMLMGITASKDLFFLTCDGRTVLNRGLLYQTGATILISHGCKDVYMLDGGGSSCMVYRGSKINRNIDGQGTVVRNISYSISFNKNTENVNEIKSFGNDGFIRQLTTKQLLQYINQNAFASMAYYSITANSDLNDYTTIGKYHCTSGSTAQTIANNPFNQAFDLYVMQYGQYNDFTMQIAVTTSHSSNGYRNQMAFRFVDTVDSLSVSPYASDWTYIIDNHPMKISLGLNESFTFNYYYNRPVMELVYRLGTGSSGISIIEYNTKYDIIKNGSGFDDYITITYDTSNHSITITNTSSGRFNAILYNGYWDE